MPTRRRTAREHQDVAAECAGQREEQRGGAGGGDHPVAVGGQARRVQ